MVFAIQKLQEFQVLPLQSSFQALQVLPQILSIARA
jgi:hypothetical protein